MENTTPPTLGKQIFLLAASRLLERISYYGIRSVLVLYLTSEAIKLSREEVSVVYGRFTMSILIAQVLGGLIGDFLAGNKKSMIIGGILQAAGCFCLTIPDMTSVYIGLGLIVLGGGMYSPNFLAQFGLFFRSKPHMTDTGFTTIYLLVSVGAFMAPLITGFMSLASIFITSGVFMLVSATLAFFTTSPKIIAAEPVKSTDNQNFTKTIIAFITAGLFWTLYDISNSGVYIIESFVTGKNEMQFSQLLILPVGILFAVIWARTRQPSIAKLASGFLLAAAALGILLLIPVTDAKPYYAVYLIAALILNIGEIHIGPVILSVIAQYGSPRYMATLMSLVSIPARMLGFIVVYFTARFSDDPGSLLKIGFVLMAVAGIVLMAFQYKRPTPESMVLDQMPEKQDE